MYNIESHSSLKCQLNEHYYYFKRMPVRMKDKNNPHYTKSCIVKCETLINSTVFN